MWTTVWTDTSSVQATCLIWPSGCDSPNSFKACIYDRGRKNSHMKPPYCRQGGCRKEAVHFGPTQISSSQFLLSCQLTHNAAQNSTLALGVHGLYPLSSCSVITRGVPQVVSHPRQKRVLSQRAGTSAWPGIASISSLRSFPALKPAQSADSRRRRSAVTTSRFSITLTAQ